MEFNLNESKEKVLTIDSIGLIYILIFGSLCHIFSIPEIVKGFLALPEFSIIPYLVGNLIVLRKITENKEYMIFYEYEQR